jgi:hypothetical protein
MVQVTGFDLFGAVVLQSKRVAGKLMVQSRKDSAGETVLNALRV